MYNMEECHIKVSLNFGWWTAARPIQNKAKKNGKKYNGSRKL